ncbi:MAG: ATP-binding cassette domain-containing protein, partial [Desulfovibrionaceae bacterium]|nr:ATP-binding cassette domain-containing protein [Desulfovibrionaceae bacterium]
MSDLGVVLSRASVSRGRLRMLEAVDWEVSAGEHWGVLGPNGAGKTTLLRLLRGDLAPDPGGGRVYHLAGRDQESPIGIRPLMPMVSPALHDFYTAGQWRVSGLELVLSGFFDTPFLYQEPSAAQRLAALRTMDELGIADLEHRTFPEMSRGQARKAFLARALAPGPAILVLDECLDGLDRRSRAGVQELLDRAASMAGLVCAVNRLSDLPRCVDRVLVLDRGRVAARGPRSQVLGEGGGLGPGQAVRRAGLLSGAVDPGFGPAFRVWGVDVVLDGCRVLENIRFEMDWDQNWAVFGPNGAGKTTFLRLLLGEVAPYAETGLVERCGPDGPWSARAMRGRCGLVSAEVQAGLARSMTVIHAVMSGFRAGVDPAEARRLARRALDLLGLSGLEHRILSSLSN